MIEDFDKSSLSKKGFFVSINDKEVTLPDGSIVHNGQEFRNKFHLHPLAKSDLFMPCGGRPAAVNISNWENLFDEKGDPKFRIIIEGANLFITEEARLRLEENGVIVIKDASTNKGGVTSSSFEVYASLALSDTEYDEHMRVSDAKVPDFRKAYIEEITRIIKTNARLEFDFLWNEHEEKGIPFTKLTNMVSSKINNLTDAVFNSNLCENKCLREKIVTGYTPDVLMGLIGIDNLSKRVPGNYLCAIMAAGLATSFVYTRGLETNEIDFYSYLRQLC